MGSIPGSGPCEGACGCHCHYWGSDMGSSIGLVVMQSVSVESCL